MRARFFLLLLLFVGCKDNERDDEGRHLPFDASKPIEVTSFMPDSGRIREKIVIKGSNFGNDKSKVKVVFKDALTERISTVIGVDNNTIYCLAPRQISGQNTISIEIDGKTVIPTRVFAYSASENVSTIAGGAGGTKTDGSLAEANFSYMHGIAALGDEKILVFQRDNPSVRYISVPDNTVITVHAGFQAGKPTVTTDRNTVYATGWDSPHTVYRYTRESGWAPSRLGALGTFARIRALALDQSEKWLYFCDRDGKFGRFEIATQEVEILNPALDIIKSGDGGYLIFDPFHDCFYMSVQAAYGIYKIAKNAQGIYEAAPYAGFNGNRVTNGYLSESAFAQPNGMTLDEDGNIFIVEGSGSYLVRKISAIDGYVSTIAGRTNVEGATDGAPVDARFSFPYDISNDGQGNYYIAEGWGVRVRKYAIE
ncbi:IPT/TIG domain-containing protein [Sphingobacterium faecium]